MKNSGLMFDLTRLGQWIFFAGLSTLSMDNKCRGHKKLSKKWQANRYHLQVFLDLDWPALCPKNGAKKWPLSDSNLDYKRVTLKKLNQNKSHGFMPAHTFTPLMYSQQPACLKKWKSSTHALKTGRGMN